jgi:type IV secretory pathway TraG/TraD family ATPase VirD4
MHLIAGTPAAASLDEKARGQFSGIISTLSIALEGFRHLPVSGDEWSAREWAQDRRGWVFISGDDDATRPLRSLWLDQLIKRLLQGEIGGPQVWVIIDELASLQRLPSLENVFTRGRKRGLSAVVGLQAVTQLRGIYGRDHAATLLSSPATKLLLRIGEPETAKWVSDAIGWREVERQQRSETAGSWAGRDSMSRSYQRRQEPVVMPSELQQLPNLTGYLVTGGIGATPVQIAPQPLQKRQPGFIPRAPLTPPQPPPVIVLEERKRRKV